MGYKRSKLDKAGLEQRRTQALRYRQAGLSYLQIGQQLGISKQTAHDDVLNALQERKYDSVDELRGTELERLEAAHQKVWAQVLEGDLKAVDTMMKIMQRRARYVPGLEIPQEHEVTAGAGTVQVVFSEKLAPKFAQDTPASDQE